MISPHNEWYIGNVVVCAHFSLKLAHGTYCVCSITQLFILLGIYYFFPMLMPKPCSGDFKTKQHCYNTLFDYKKKTIKLKS